MKKLRVLLVDDDPLALEGIQRMLHWEAFGGELAGCAASGEEALALPEAERPDVVISDIRMPGMDGLEVIRQAREEGILAGLCEAAYGRWAGSLREGVAPEDCRGAFLAACAWTALAGMSGALEAAQPTPLSFSAGDLTVNTGRSERASACAGSLLAQAEVLMAPYTADGGFAFLGVRG